MELRKLLLAAFVLSGMAALVYELAWIRPLQFLLGSTTYTISIIFAAFMSGLALGSFIVSKYVDRIKHLVRTYALIELGIGLYGILLLSMFNMLPKIYNTIYFLHSNFYLFELFQLILVFLVLLIPTTLMGATLPVVAKFYTKQKIGKGIGEVYAANNLGAILGSFSAGFILIPLLGIKSSIIFAGAVNLLVAIALLFIVAKDSARKIIPIALLLFLLFAYFGDYSIKQMHSGGFYRTHEEVAELGDIVYYEEGLYATVTVRELTKPQAKALFINGKGQGSTEIPDLRVNFLLAYLPLLINPESENALVIGLGTGTTSGQLAQFVETKTIEIEPSVVGASRYFNSANLDVLDNPNHQLVIEDGRNHLLKNNKKYDLIIPEPSDPWQSFSSTLFSKEFFELASRHLDEGGLYMQWVPVYELGVDEFKSFYRTFSSVFPNVLAFANTKPDENTPVRFGTSEIILVGSKNKIGFSDEEINSNYNLLPIKSRQYLDAIRLSSGDEIYRLFLFDSEDMKNYANGADFITDNKPILEFSTARKVLYQNPEEVINDIEVFLESE